MVAPRQRRPELECDKCSGWKKRRPVSWIGYSAARSVSAECSAAAALHANLSSGEQWWWGPGGGRSHHPKKQNCLRGHKPEARGTHTWDQVADRRRLSVKVLRFLLVFRLIRVRRLQSAGATRLCSSSCSPGSSGRHRCRSTQIRFFQCSAERTVEPRLEATWGPKSTFSLSHLN